MKKILVLGLMFISTVAMADRIVPIVPVGKVMPVSEVKPVKNNEIIPIGNNKIKPKNEDTYTESKLIMAIEKYDEDEIKAIVEQGADVNAKGGHHNWTPLQTAAMLGQKDTIKLLLSKGAKVDNIFTAAAVSDVNTFKKFLPEGKFVNKSDDYFGDDIFYYAVNNDNIEIVKFLFDNGIDVNKVLMCGETPLANALRFGKWEMAKLLLDKGAKVTPDLLNRSAETVNADVFKLLLDKSDKADLNNLLYTAAINGNKDVLDLLVAKGAKADNIITLIALGKKQEVQNYLKNGKFTSVKTKDVGGSKEAELALSPLATAPSVNITPLYVAVINNQLETAKLLVKNGEDINDGKTEHFPGYGNGVIAAHSSYTSPLRAAAERNYMEMAKFLLDNKVEVNVEDNIGQTALDYAKTEEMKKLLLKYGARKGSGMVLGLM